MLTAQQRIHKLQEAIALLQDVDALQQKALGDSDVCFDNHTRIQDLIDDLVADIVELDNGQPA